MRSPLYWAVCGAVLILAILTGFSIGLFILPIGLALLVLGPVRHRPSLFWPPLIAVVGFVTGFVLFVPMTCTATATIPGEQSATVCSSILGPDYRTPGTVSPPTDLALVAGASGAVVGAFGTIGARSLAKRRGMLSDGDVASGPSSDIQ